MTPFHTNIILLINLQKSHSATIWNRFSANPLLQLSTDQGDSCIVRLRVLWHCDDHLSAVKVNVWVIYAQIDMVQKVQRFYIFLFSWYSWLDVQFIYVNLKSENNANWILTYSALYLSVHDLNTYHFPHFKFQPAAVPQEVITRNSLDETLATWC